MRKATIFLAALFLALASHAYAQQDTEFLFNVPLSTDYMAPYSQGEDGGGVHSGARAVYGPVDLDNDGQQEVLVSDYTGGGRVHVIENTGVDTWELAYSTPWVDSTATTENIRTIAAGDLDNDGNGEIFFLAGRDYSATNPNIASLPVGLYAYEFNGTDFGDLPVSVYEFDGDLLDRFRAEQMVVADVDGDGSQELMFGNNGSDNRYDAWYILSITGDFGSGFETWVTEARLSSRASEDFDPVDRGGGSPYAIHPADLDGDGDLEIVLHAWNNFVLTNGEVTGANTYDFSGEFVQAADADQVAFFGGVVIDINDDGDDEVYFGNLQSGDLALLNYESGEDPLTISRDQAIIDLIPDITTLGIAAGDLDQDDKPGIFGSGLSYGAANIEAEEEPTFVRVAEYLGGDVEDPANYAVGVLDFFEDFDLLETNVDLVMRDSLGEMSEYFEDTGFTGKNRAGGHPGQGALFVSKMAYLGDVDGDGKNELAVAFQGVDDSTYVIQETWNETDETYTREIVERRAVENRVFLRIVQSDINAVAVEDGADVPSGFKLSANYPNPFNPSTSFSFTLPRDARVSVKIYDITGRLIKTLVDNRLHSSGTYQATWDGTSAAGITVASGTYFYSLEHDGTRQVRPMLLVK